jgi:UDP-N-acetyl-D-mannosaminuronate dehydrogenase
LGQSKSMNVSVIGLGKLGAPLVAVMASKGHNVIGVDLNRRAVDLLDAGTVSIMATVRAAQIGCPQSSGATICCGVSTTSSGSPNSWTSR